MATRITRTPTEITITGPLGAMLFLFAFLFWLVAATLAFFFPLIVCIVLVVVFGAPGWLIAAGMVANFIWWGLTVSS